MTNKEIRLIDLDARGRARNWRGWMEQTQEMARIYQYIDAHKARQMRQCGRHLGFGVRADGQKKLIVADFCRNRLCPQCARRRSLKIAGNTSRIIDALGDSFRYILLTLTVRNVSGDELSGTIDAMMAAFKRMTARAVWRHSIAGYMRSLECTYSRHLGTYHPHFHLLMAVPASYFDGDGYLTHDDFMRLWQESMRLDYSPSVDVRRVKDDATDAVRETAKYCVKFSLLTDKRIRFETRVDVVATFDKALAGRRLVSYGGIFKKVFRQLKLKDAEAADADLDGDDDDGSFARYELYQWRDGDDYYLLTSGESVSLFASRAVRRGRSPQKERRCVAD